MKYLVAFVVAVIVCGCVQESPQSSETFTEAGSEAASTSVKEEVTSTSQSTVTTTSSSTSSTLENFDYSALVVEVSACGVDDYGNALVAGQIYNPTGMPAPGFELKTRLEDSMGETVAEKEISVAWLGAKVRRQFSAVYENPPDWVRCYASTD